MTLHSRAWLQFVLVQFIAGAAGNNSLPAQITADLPQTVEGAATRRVAFAGSSASQAAAFKLTCSDAWQQCGGKQWAGPTCCSSGYACTFSSDWYSQCVPLASGTQTSSLASSSSSSSSSSSLFTTTTRQPPTTSKTKDLKTTRQATTTTTAMTQVTSVATSSTTSTTRALTTSSKVASTSLRTSSSTSSSTSTPTRSPPASSTTASASSTTTTIRITTTSSSSIDAGTQSTKQASCAAGWQQCGGAGWAGPSCCVAGYQCVIGNSWYSQCVPIPTTMGSSSTSTTTTAPGSCQMPSGMTEISHSFDNRGFANKHGKLRLSGTQLVDESGKPVQLRGMSSHGLQWFSKCYTKETLQFLAASWGITVFRIAMYIAENGFATDKSVFTKAQDIITWCEEIGIYVILDWHVLTPGDPNYWLTGAGRVDADALAFWNSTATLYKSKRHVLYEICNEPNGVDWPTVKTYADTILRAIRTADPETVVIVGTPTWSQDIDQAASNPVSFPYNVMYAFHFYAGTHMFLLPKLRLYASKVPVFVTEWGASYASGDGGPFLDNSKQFLDLLGDASQLGVSVSWAQWSYAGLREASAALQDGVCDLSPAQWDAVSCSGQFVRSYLRFRAWSELATTLLQVAAPAAHARLRSAAASLLETCAAEYQQCGGRGWEGPACCPPGFACEASDTYYSQCRPGAGSPASSTSHSPWSESTMYTESTEHPLATAASSTTRQTTTGSEQTSAHQRIRRTTTSRTKATTTSSASQTEDPLPPGCTLPGGMPVKIQSNSTHGFASRHGKLRLDGPQLVDERGEPVQLRGLSSHGVQWFPSCYTKEALAFLVEEWGITVFRAAMYIGEDGFATDPSVLDTVRGIVDWCEQLGIYVIIDWHVLSPGDPNYWLTGPGQQQADAATFWGEIAKQYTGKRHVLYEICNEPNGVDWPTVKSYADKVLNVIRSADAETIVIVGTPNWSQDVDQAAASPVVLPHNVMYSFHFYAGTHMFLLPKLRQYIPTLPIFVTEWGTSQASGDGSPYLQEAKEFLDLLGGQLGVTVSWAQWSYADKGEASAVLSTGSCSQGQWGAVSCSGAFVRSYLALPVATTSTRPVSPAPVGSGSPDPAAPTTATRRRRRSHRSPDLQRLTD